MPGETVSNTENIQTLDDGAEVEQRSKLKRVGIFCGKLAALGTIMAGSAVAGVFHEPVSTNVGPHEAEVDLTLDSAATFDLGPIGSIIKPITGTNGIGAHITVGEVPMRENGVDAEAYARSLANFEGDIANMKSDLAEQGIRYGLYGGVVAVGSYVLLGRRRRQELIEPMSRPSIKTGLATLSAVGLIGASVIGTSTVSSAESRAVLVDDIFNDTPLEGSRVTGEFLPHIVNTYGREIINRWQENDNFYDQVLVNTASVYENQRRLLPREGYPIMLFYADLHCNVGMARVIGEVARLSNANLIADGGDTTMGGTSYEKFCIEILDNELPDIPRVVAGGNHDSNETEKQYRRFGFTPLDGKATEVAGLTFVGDDDLMRSAFGTGILRERDETSEQMNDRMAELSCNPDAEIDVLLVHDPEVTQRTLDEQCVNTILSGHVHRETIQTTPQPNDNTILNIIGDNASGANKQRPTLGPVESQARLYIVKFNQSTGLPMFYQTFTVNPDTSVELSDIVMLRQNAPLEVE